MNLSAAPRRFLMKGSPRAPPGLLVGIELVIAGKAHCAALPLDERSVGSLVMLASIAPLACAGGCCAGRRPASRRPISAALDAVGTVIADADAGDRARKP
jgi:hypothetical protein